MTAIIASLLLAAEPPLGGLFVEAPALPQGSTWSASSQAGGTPSGGIGGIATVIGMTPRISLTAGATYDAGRSSPTAGVRVRLLDFLAVSGRVKGEGFIPESAEAEASVHMAVRLGRLDLLAEGTIGKGEEVDVEAAGGARAFVTNDLALGLEGRYRTTPDRSLYDVIVGPTVAYRFPAVMLQLVAGYGDTNGRRGFAAVAGLSVYR